MKNCKWFAIALVFGNVSNSMESKIHADEGATVIASTSTPQATATAGGGATATAATVTEKTTLAKLLVGRVVAGEGLCVDGKTRYTNYHSGDPHILTAFACFKEDRITYVIVDKKS